MENDRRIYTLSEANPAGAVIRMGLPLVAGMFIMVLYNLTDTYFIGLTRDDYQLAAVNLAYPVMMIMIAISNMTGAGASSLIARCMGAGDNDKARHALTTGFVLTFVSSIVLAALGLGFLTQIVGLLGAKDNTFLYTTQYVKVILWFSFFTMGSYTFGQLLRSEGSVKQSIFGMILGTFANIILDPVFIFGLKLGVMGAAVATVIGNFISMMVTLYIYISGKSLLKPDIRFIIPSPEVVKEIFTVGIPATLETLLTSVAYVVNNNLAVSYGELTVAAMGVAQKILSLGTYIYQGMATGVQPIMGYNFGAKNYKRMLEVLKAGVLVVSGIELFVMAVYAVFAPALIGIFTDSAEVTSVGARVLRTLMFILPFVGAVSMCRMSFQAMGKAGYAFSITFVRQLVLYVPLLLVLNSFFGFGGMIWAQPLTEVIMMVSSIILLRRVIVSYMNTQVSRASLD